MILSSKDSKPCTKCGDVKPLSEFRRKKVHKDGHTNRCKECQREHDKKYRVKNLERIKASHKKYRAQHPEKAQAANKKYAARHPEKKNAYSRKYYALHPERSKEYSIKYYIKNREKILTYSKKYRATHPRDPEELNERNRQWRAKNPDKNKARDQKRRARKRNAAGTFDHTDIQILLDAQKNTCLLCGKKFSQENSYSVDHIVPLSKEGRNDLLNLQLLHKSCNSKKSTKVQDLRSKKVKAAIFQQGSLF